ncbi:immunoglobulin-like domain-containing protein [Aquimarina spinulae]|uniref:immunoglobulin-like domain-containing protein n=1 Tax=Aquimarina spinulae TaxID=1192023 RepID=UPI00131EF192|nr:immunoglobulin-like domain-containing protein [Aquimarina spinulae]
MIKKLLLVFLVCLNGFLYGQETNVPDDNFESYLETHDANGNTVFVGDASSMGNGIAGDNQVTTSRIVTVTSLDISSKMISDITGIEDFTALEILNFSTNGVGNFDLSNNINLKELYCASNGMSGINVTANINLEVLDASGNFYTAVDVSSNIKLKTLNLASSGATSLNLGNISTLEEIDVSNNNLTNLDISNLSSLTDLNCDTNYNLRITDFSASTDLVHLNCNNTDLRSLDVSSNTLLETLKIDFVSGFDIDLSNNIVLTSLSAQSSDLTSLNIKNGNNSNITSFDVRFNQFSCIQVDDPTASYLSTWQKDSTTTFNLDCSVTSVPDINFEYYLENHDANGNVVAVGNPSSLGNGKVDDGYVLTSRIATVTSLNISFFSVGDLTGIEDFTALEIFNCSNNDFNDLDLSNQPNLKELYCHNVFVSIIDVSANLNLEKLIVNDANCITLTIGENTVITELNASNNKLTVLDITDFTTLEILDFSKNYNLDITDFSALTNLEILNCSDTGLRSIDLSANTLLEVLTMNNMSGFDVDLSSNAALTSFSARESDLSSINIQNGNNANITNFDARLNDITLNCIQVDDPIASYLSSWDKDATTVFSLDCSETNVPDDNFENYLETHDATGNTVLLGDANSMGNGIANDNTIYTSRIANITSLNITDLGIADLTGIEDFVALQDLNCYNNGLSSIDVSENLALLTLNISRNSLTDLDVSKNTLLTELHVARNSLTSLDVSQNIVLITLGCSQNQLNGLDVTKNTVLKNLYCYTNPLGSLDVTQNTVLESLDCVESQLTSLDVSQNPELQYLQVYDNLLTSLDVSNNVKLIELYVEYNQIASLDVSKNTVLEDLSCFSNQLTYLNIRNGNNTNLDHRDFDITNNPGLTCVAVDDPAYATTTFTKKDVQTSFSTFCNTTYVPDDNFETYLETHNSIGGVVTLGDPTSMGNGIANDDYVGTEKILNIKNLNISNQGITDLTGLEAFIGLEELRAFGNTVSNLDLTANINLIVAACSNMGLTSINVSGLTALNTLELNTNQLSSIDVSSNVSLENLRIINNQLSSIDVSANKGLRDLRIQGNNLISLDISANTVLRYLSCVDNDLTNLDVQNNVLLENLSCGKNQFTTIDVGMLTNLIDLFIEDTPTLTSLDVSSNVNLEDIGVDNNTSLTSLNLSNNTKLIEVYINNTSITALDFSNSPDLYYVECQNNALTSLNFKNGNTVDIDDVYSTGNPNLSCITVDDPTASYLASWNKDATANFAEYCRLTYVPNDNFEALLEARGFGNGIANDDYVYTALIENETTLIIQDNDITDLTGIEDFESLEIFLCRRSNVETVDISNNTKLTHVNLVDNSLTALDVSTNVLLQEVYINGNSALGTVDISTLVELTTFNVSDTGINTIDVSNNPLIRVLVLNDNEFTTLDVSSYPNLVQVLIANNKLTSLNVANGNNTNFTWFDASGNPDLTCIQVDDVNGNFNLWTKDATANYAHYCELTNVPDDNFENYLETHDANGNAVTIGDALSMGNGIANDNQVATSKIETVTTLNIEHQDIADLTGIEAFVSLESFNCDYNDLTTLNLSSNVNLKVLNAAENDFTLLDFTGYLALEEINLRSNFITNLLLDNNPNLKKLNAGKNALTTLDVTSCIQLEELAVHQNLLESLDVRNGNNNLITNFFVLYNPNLTCIEVDNPTATYLSSWKKDDIASFSEDCVPPVITLLGDNPQVIELGSGYTELGATVDDGVTNLVIDISDFVDAVGIYTIRYNATDNAGNIAEEVIRTVEVVDNCPLNNVSANNFTITTTSETCADKNNGTIAISVETVLDYRTTINGVEYSFTSTLAVDNLPPGIYPVCIAIEGFASCEQCFEMVIEEAESLTGKTELLVEAGTAKVNVEVTTGTAPYIAKVNNKIVGEYTTKNFTLDVQHGDELEVSSNVDCEGKLSTKVSLFDQVSIAPNPTKGDITLTLPDTQLQTINVSMYNALGAQVSSGVYSITSRQVTLPMEQLPQGIYFVSIDHGATFKIVKQ